MTIPGAGATLTFAPGAVSSPTVITFTAMKGKDIAYGFAPHGLVFNAPVTIVQDMRATSLKTSYDSASVVHGAYIPNGAADIDQTDKRDRDGLVRRVDGLLHRRRHGCDPSQHLALRHPALLRLHPQRRRR